MSYLFSIKLCIYLNIFCLYKFTFILQQEILSKPSVTRDFFIMQYFIIAFKLKTTGVSLNNNFRNNFKRKLISKLSFRGIEHSQLIISP